MPDWTSRDVSREAAAAALYINVNSLDQWLFRYKAPSGKVGKNRVFSLHDLVVIQTARQLLSPGILASDAMRIAKECVVAEPEKSAVIYVTATNAWLGKWDDDWPEETTTMVYPWHTLRSIKKRLEAGNVAVQH